ncbi:hypothetical protein USB125703_01046 [Pseudoclavibacter triregionum]|nr:hypothetical protein USB125703_01046 [Pseudoclavibacter triregionum]
MDRSVVLFAYDPDGRLDRGARRLVEAVRPHAARLLLVSNGSLEDESRAWAADRVDALLERPNEGFDVAAYRAGIETLGERALEHGELLLLNCTCFGPIGEDPAHGLDAVFAASDALDAGIWGLTEHPAISPDPFLHRGVLPAHLQSHWIGVRREVLASGAWREYWDSMPEIRSYEDSIRHHETRFTAWFRSRGVKVAALYPLPHGGRNGADANPSMARPLELLDAGCPMVKRRLAWHDPLELDHRGVAAAEALERAVAGGIPMTELLDGVRDASPRAVAANLGCQAVAREAAAGERPAARAASLAEAGTLAAGMPDDEVILVGAETAPSPRAERELGTLGAEALARALADAPWAALAILPPDDLGADVRGAGEGAHLREQALADALGLGPRSAAGRRIAPLDAVNPLDPAGGPLAIRAGLARRLAALAAETGAGGAGSIRAATRSGDGAADSAAAGGPVSAGGSERDAVIELALGALAPSLALAEGAATLEVATAQAWARRASRAGIREATLRATLPAGVREPFAVARARAGGPLSPAAAARIVRARAPRLVEAARAVLAAVRRR